MSAARVGVLLAAGAASWERTALEALDRPGGQVALVKRCLDLADLLATAATGTAGVAVLAEALPGLDADSVERLGRRGVRVVVVADAASRDRLTRMGVASVVDQGAVAGIAAHVAGLGAHAAPGTAEHHDAADTLTEASTPATTRGRVVAVWGPHGAPGRTTVAVALAAEAAAAGVGTLLVDADPYGGAVAQHLAVLEEVSGLLAAARAANAGELERERLARLARQVGPRLRVLTGLPRPDRWSEVRPQAFRDLLEAARTLDALVVVDCGPGLASPDAESFAAGPDRDAVTGVALEEADVVVVVGAADPVGLTRLARSLPDVPAAAPTASVRVVVNRMRSTLGWSREEVGALLAGVLTEPSGTREQRSTAPVRFLPDDRAAADGALVAGRPLTDCGESTLRAALRGLAADLLEHLDLGRPQPRRAGGLRARLASRADKESRAGKSETAAGARPEPRPRGGKRAAPKGERRVRR